MLPDLGRRAMMRNALLAALAGALPLGKTAVAFAQNSGEHIPGARDFDFFIGAWRVRHRRLKRRLAGSDEWQRFDGTCHVRSLLDGLANIDDSFVDLPGGAYRGIGLRAYDPDTRHWADWWLDGRRPHKIDVPVIGTFADGMGTFLSDDTFEGRPIKVRGRFSQITSASLQWEQAYSADGGRTWETNWVMRYSRIA
ncbi:DUF1579 domain-containing protein [Luteimonas sp. SX5]|uniref:DUF1579 domain-containing protein n=1 Tax=Luteimonas galliterrae TaxID=2940486 RepID=A0ABT0MM86_9GAMM|nr:DUF1579 domain-containing protein [Luteimonas galliterrae]MCL1635783.1 DUF1579 domain-containing protein [Luteimonas galliterrae]